MVKRLRLSDGAGLPVPVGQVTRIGGSPMFDTLQNLVTGLGTAKDKSYGTTFVFTEMAPQQQEAAYRGDWIARKIVDIPAHDATREWRSWQADKTDITKIEDVEKAFGIQRKTARALRLARLYGGAGMILGVDQGLPEEPLDIERVGVDALKFVHVVSRWDLAAGPIDWNIMSPYYGTPSYYTRSGNGVQSNMKIHPSRVVRFVGMEHPNLNLANGWGDSVLQALQDAIIGAGSTTSSISQLIAESKIDVVSIPELSENMSSKEYEERLRARFGLANMIKSIYSMLLIDKEEQWQRISANFTGMPDVLKMYLLIACGAGDIPATRFLGQSAAGFNNGDNDVRNYYDRVATEQKVELTPTLNPLDQILVRTALGSYPDGLFYNWNSLWQMTEQEKADIAVKKAQVMTADVNAGLLTPVVLQKGRENQLIEDGTYPGLEQIIEEFGDDIDEREDTTEPVDDPNVDPENPDDPNAPDNVESSAPNKTPRRGANDARKSRAPIKRERLWADRTAARVRRTPIADATPRTLYIRRDVINGGEILKWAKSAGIKNLVPASELHVTVAYVKQPVDWLKVGTEEWTENDQGEIVVKPGGPRMMESFGPAGEATVLVFSNSALQYRHMRVLRIAEYEGDYPEYQPHITLSYDSGLTPAQLLKVKAFTGQIKLGPEIFEEVKDEGDDWRKKLLGK